MKFPRACDICSRVKVTRKSFNKIGKSNSKEVGDFISCDMGVFINCLSREGFIYVLVFTYHANKYTWLYGSRNKDEALDCLKDLVMVQLKRIDVKLKHYDANGAGGVDWEGHVEILRRMGGYILMVAIGHSRVEWSIRKKKSHA